MLKTVTIFLTPDKDHPGKALIAAFPDPVRLVINIVVDDDGTQTVEEVDAVSWQYSKLPPPDSKLDAFPGAPEPIDINVEVRFPPLKTPFGTTPSGSSAFSLLPAAETESYENIGVNPLVPNLPRLDSAPEPAEPFGFPTASGPVEGPEQDYEYAVILTSRTNVNTVDPKIIIVRRHRRSTL